MMNQLVMVGRLVSDPKEEVNKDGERDCSIKLAITSSQKNKKGEYETDIINCIVEENIYKNLVDYCKKGDILGIKGHIKGSDDNNMHILCDRITFLNSTKQKEDQEIER